MAMERIDKLLVTAGAGSRSQVKDLIRKGRVRLNGALVKRPEEKADPDRDQLTLDAKPVDTATYVYWVMNKPQGVITATEDKKQKTVLDLLPIKRTDLFPVGRLDKDTEGLLLITNDGDLAHRLLAPKSHVDKTYYLRTDKTIPETAAARFLQGVDLGDFTTMPAVYEPLSSTEGRLTIREGKFHQVKRMLEAVGCEVIFLKRLSMGPLGLDPDLQPGEARPLTEEEIQALQQTGKPSASQEASHV